MPANLKSDTTPRFLRLKSIIGTPDNPGLIPISRSAWYQGIKRGTYPPPIRLGPRVSIWRFSDIESLIEGKAAGSVAPTIPLRRNQRDCKIGVLPDADGLGFRAVQRSEGE